MSKNMTDLYTKLQNIPKAKDLNKKEFILCSGLVNSILLNYQLSKLTYGE